MYKRQVGQCVARAGLLVWLTGCAAAGPATAASGATQQASACGSCGASASEEQPTALSGGAGSASQAIPAFPSALPHYFATLVEGAKQDATAAAPVDAPIALPASLQDLSAQQYATIRFRPEKALWSDPPGQFEVQFFHLGSHYRHPVALFELDAEEDDQPAAVPFSTDLFSYDGIQPPAADAKLGFAGLRVHAPLNRADYRDEVIVFQGASYFRALGRGNAHGVSGRGLALDTGEPSGEEFPRFTEMYLVRPRRDDRALWLLARLDGARTTGAYAFRITPGEQTLVDVSARVFFREPVNVVGIAPLTSMFMFDEQHPGRFGDFRPEVHDSDGLALHAGSGERIFRPLRNPKTTTMTAFRLDHPKGFGLLQRDRSYTHYHDLRERYQDRPSVFVEPIGDWGKGAVWLYEIASRLESDDNVGAFWKPDVVPREGLDIHYRLHVGNNVPPNPRSGRVVNTHRQATANGMSFLIDFDTMTTAPTPMDQVQLELSAQGGHVPHSEVQANPFTHGYRAAFEVIAEDPGQSVELRAFLRQGDRVLTETWSYLWQAQDK